MRIRRTMTVSLPPEMVAEVDTVRRAEHRTRSELVREALRTYFVHRLPAAEATLAERAAIARGRAEFKRGEYLSLDQLKGELKRGAKQSMEPGRRPVGRKTA